MICHLIACAIVFGTAQQCDLSQPVESIPLPKEAARTWVECRDGMLNLREMPQNEARAILRITTPANFRIVRFEFFTPQTQIEEARGK